MPKGPNRIHYLRENKGERTPHRFLVIDAEAEIEPGEKRELQTLRLWASRLVRRHDREPEKPRFEDSAGFDLDGLLETVQSSASSKETLWVFAHNLSYDLALTRLPLALIQAGWTLGEHNLASEAPWAHLKRKSRSLRLADSWSWLPYSVEKLGEVLRIAKPALPAPDATEAAWLRRCRADANITAAAIEALMDEWDRRALGWWSLTGPASGWNSMLHFHTGERGKKHSDVARTEPGQSKRAHRAAVVIDPDPAARALEREAIYSGRRDLWRVGKLGPGPYVELDLKTAHLAICAGLPLPYRRWVTFDRLAADDWRLVNPGAGLLARVVVETETPRYPLRIKGAIVHPVGRFETTLATPEIRDAQARGELVSVGPGYGYHLGWQMRDWSNWALAVLNSNDPEIDPLLQLMVKGWSRTVPGRWGMTIAREIANGPSHVPDWSLEPATVGNPPRRGFILHLAGRWSEQIKDQEADDSFPAVLAHIQSWTRLLLGRLIESLPEGCLVSCNTEGVWVHEAAIRGLDALARGPAFDSIPAGAETNAALALLNTRTEPVEVRVKQQARTLRLLSPQHLEIDGRHHYAGVPSSAQQISPDTFSFWTWPKLRSQIEKGDPRGYVRVRRQVSLGGLPVSRWSFEDGCCEPLRVTWSAETGNVAQASPGVCSCHGARLRGLQHPALRMALRA